VGVAGDTVSDDVLHGIVVYPRGLPKLIVAYQGPIELQFAFRRFGYDMVLVADLNSNPPTWPPGSALAAPVCSTQDNGQSRCIAE
jgi:hypothetical protein